MQDNQNKIKYLNGGMAFCLMILCYFIIMVLGDVILLAVGLTGGMAFFCIKACYSALAMIIIGIWACSKSTEKPSVVLGAKKFNPAYIVYALLLSVVMLFGFGFINQTIQSFLVKIGYNVSNESQMTVNSLTEYFVYLIFFALLPAVCEECFFRGVMLRGINCNKITVSLIVGLCFAVYHLNATQMFYQFIYGVSLTYLALHSKSVIPGIIAHFVNNFLVLTMSYFHQSFRLDNFMVIVMAWILLVIYWASIIPYKSKKQYCDYGEDHSNTITRFWLPFGIVGFVTCAILITVNFTSAFLIG